MMKFAAMNASGASTVAAGIRYGRVASGTWLRNAASDSGAPAYISTVADVISPTSDCQFGNGSRNGMPTRNEMMSENHGTPRLSVQVKIGGKYRFRPRP